MSQREIQMSHEISDARCIRTLHMERNVPLWYVRVFFLLGFEMRCHDQDQNVTNTD